MCAKAIQTLANCAKSLWGEAPRDSAVYGSWTKMFPAPSPLWEGAGNILVQLPYTALSRGASPQRDFAQLASV